MKYDLELEKAVKAINEQGAKLVCIQLPDGLKPKAAEITDYLKQHAANPVEVITWAGSCFGACDLPLEVERLGVDLLIAFGHTEWEYVPLMKK